MELIVLNGFDLKPVAKIGFRTTGPVTQSLHGVFKPNEDNIRIFV